MKSEKSPSTRDSRKQGAAEGGENNTGSIHDDGTSRQLQHKKRTRGEDGNTIYSARGGLTKVEAKRKKDNVVKDVVPNLDAETQKKFKTYLKEHKPSKKRIEKYYHQEEDEFIESLDENKQRAMARRQKQGHHETELDRLEVKRTQAAYEAAVASNVLETTTGANLVEAENPLEKTYLLNQKTLKSQFLDENTARHIFDLNLTDGYGPYGMVYDRTGRHSILYGKTGGHVAMMDNHVQSLVCEFHLNEPVHSATVLHNHTLFGVAQQKYLYIYDDHGREIHYCDHIRDPLQLDYLPYHWLLVCGNRWGSLYYQDTSTGQLVADLKTRLGPVNALSHNPMNAVVHCGHTNGSVTLWTPVCKQYLMKLQCNRGAVLDLAIDTSGRYMVTSGADKLVKVWDLRHTYKCLNIRSTINHASGNTIDISQSNGIIAVGHGSMATFWKDAFTKSSSSNKEYTKMEPYMQHKFKNGRRRRIETVRFRPFEDVCGIGHSDGISSIVVPGTGEPTLDSSRDNPFADNKQRREMDVRNLLDKLPPNSISIEGSNLVGRVAQSRTENEKKGGESDDDEGAGDGSTKERKKKKEKNKMRGKNKLAKKLAKKEQNVIDQRIVQIRKKAEDDAKDESDHEDKTLREKQTKKEAAPPALQRFFS